MPQGGEKTVEFASRVETSESETSAVFHDAREILMSESGFTDHSSNNRNDDRSNAPAFVSKSSTYTHSPEGKIDRRMFLAFGGESQREVSRQNFRKLHKANLRAKGTTFSMIRFRVGKFVNNDVIQIAMIVLIIINAMIMGIATFDFVTDDANVSDLFSNIDRGFLIIYSVELIMQFMFYGWRLIQDAWLVFDLFVVAVSWAFDFQDSGSQIQIIRAFRIFRAFRLINRIKVLRDLVEAVGQVIPRMTAIGMLLILIFYIFAVLFTELFKDLDLTEPYFKTLDASLLTCAEMMTLEWASIAREVMEEKSWAWMPFVAFIAITGFIVFNLIIAVICDAVSIVDKIAREREAKELGIVLESPEEKLEYAENRIILLTHQVDDMLATQKQMQDMMEVMATELYRLDTQISKQFGHSP